MPDNSLGDGLQDGLGDGLSTPGDVNASPFDPDTLKLPLTVLIATTASWTVGDTLPVLQVILQDGNGAVDLTDASIHMQMEQAYVSDTLLVDTDVPPNADQTGSNKGSLSYHWMPGDIAADGKLTIQFRVTWDVSRIATWHCSIMALAADS